MTITVLQLQKALSHLGFPPGRIDGVYGTNTDTAFSGWNGIYRRESGVYASVDVSDDRRSVSVTPEDAELRLRAAARAYDHAHPTVRPEDPPPLDEPASSSSSSGALLFVALGGAALWASGFFTSRGVAARRALAGLRRKRRRR